MFSHPKSDRLDMADILQNYSNPLTLDKSVHQLELSSTVCDLGKTAARMETSRGVEGEPE